jgi:hypothetical protein
MMEGRYLIRRSLAIESWVSERKMVFAANFGLWIMGEREKVGGGWCN